MKTTQEIFNISYLHVLRQGRPSGYHRDAINGDDFQCKYRADDGAQCAAAPFITEYDPRMEDSHWRTVCERFPTGVDFSAIEHQDLVMALQNAHDTSAAYRGDFISAFKMRARDVAQRYELKIPEDE